MSVPRAKQIGDILQNFHLYISFLVNVKFEHVHFVGNFILVHHSTGYYNIFIELSMTHHRVILEIPETYFALLLKRSPRKPLALYLIVHPSILVHVELPGGLHPKSYRDRVSHGVVREQVHY